MMSYQVFVELHGKWRRYGEHKHFVTRDEAQAYADWLVHFLRRPIFTSIRVSN